MFEKLGIAAVYPEIILLVMAIVIALVDLYVKSPRRTTTYVLTLLTMGVVAYLQADAATQGQTFYSFGNMVVSDPMGGWLKCFAALAVMVTLVYGRPYRLSATCCVVVSCSPWVCLLCWACLS